MMNSMTDSKWCFSGRKSMSRTKLKAVSQEERLQKRKEHFKNQLRTPPKIADKPTEEITNGLLDIKLSLCKKNLMQSWKKSKGEKLPALTKYFLKYERQGNLMTYFVNYAMLSIDKTTEKWTKGCILPFPKKDDLRITKNYRGITLNSIVAKVYNALLLNYIQSEIKKILWKHENGFWRNQSTTS